MLNKKLPNGFVLGAFVKDNETAKGIVIGSRQPGDATTKGVVMLMCDKDGKTHLIINKDLLEELNGEIVVKNWNEAYLPAGFERDPVPGVTHKCPHCGKDIVRGHNPDVLCRECQAKLGHFFYSAVIAENAQTPHRAKVHERDGAAYCSHCDSILVCDDCGDMPEICPYCSTTLDWSNFKTPTKVISRCDHCSRELFCNDNGELSDVCPFCGGVLADPRNPEAPNLPATIVSGDHTFTVVDEVPLGYEIWNIGKHMVDGYLPFCRILPGEGRRVEIDTLKAIKTEGAQTILAAIGAGHKTIAEMEAFIEENQEKHPLTWEYAQVQRIRAALPFMRQLRWPTK